MEYINYDKYLREFERSLYERELKISKRLLEDYEDFKKVIVPVIKKYIKLSINKNFKTTAQGLLVMCDIGAAQLKAVCDSAKNTTLEELRTMNKNFSMSMELIQKKYEHIVTKELPEIYGDEFNV